MGQYFKPLTQSLIKNEVLVWSLNPKDTYDSNGDMDFVKVSNGEVPYIGVKLMEHAYYGNKLTDAFSKYLYNNPTRVWWVGDYAEDHEIEDSPLKTMNKYFSWPLHLYDISKFGHFFGFYLVNHSKRVAFKLDTDEVDGSNIYPVALLTAVGNGRGGGDYYGENLNLVGSWAGDVISIEDSVPMGYTVEEHPIFKED